MTTHLIETADAPRGMIYAFDPANLDPGVAMLFVEDALVFDALVPGDVLVIFNPANGDKVREMADEGVFGR
jgi:hypothetical protein